jgi:endonuclease YncB( thermonuclease family)
MAHRRRPGFAPRRAALEGKSARRLLAAGLFLLACCHAQAQPAPRKGDQILGQATVHDGISLDIKSERFRLWGIDVPERGAWCWRNGRRWKPADAAAAALRRCIGGRTVTCRVASVKREGWASDYTCYSDGYYRDHETEAKIKGLGLWICDNGPGTKRWGRNGPGVPCETPYYRPTGPGPK